MLYDGISISEGGSIINASIASGTSFPANPNVGELFYRTDEPNDGMHVYDGAGWELIGSGGTVDFDGLNVKAAVRLATTGSITLSGEQTIDGVSAVAGNRVLVKNQGTGSQNGIYVVATGAWTRSTDFDGSPANEVRAGDFVFVTEGATQADTGWVLTTNGTITVGTTSLSFAQFAPTVTSLTATQIAYGSGTNTVTSSSLLTWDNTNRVLTIGSSTTANTSTLRGATGSSAAAALVIRGGTGGGSQSGGALTIRAGDSELVGSGGSNPGPNLNLYAGAGGGTAGNGGHVIIYTQPTSIDAFVERVRFVNTGAWGLSGANFGTTGQMLTSNGPNSPPTWTTPPSASPLYDVAASVTGKPGNNAVIMTFTAVRSFSFPTNMTSSRAASEAAATASTVFSITKNGSQFATATFAAAATTATFSGSATSFVAGDVLRIVAPMQDATLENIGFTLVGTV